MIRYGFRCIEEFIRIKMKRNISALKWVELRVLLTIFENARTNLT